MAIDKKLIHFKTKENFISQGVGSEENVTKPTEGSEENGNAIYGQLKGTSIVFIKDSNEIWTHGNLYKSVNWSVLEKPKTLITFTVNAFSYQAEEGMNWGEWINSTHSKTNPYAYFSLNATGGVLIEIANKGSLVKDRNGNSVTSEMVITTNGSYVSASAGGSD